LAEKKGVFSRKLRPKFSDIAKIAKILPRKSRRIPQERIDNSVTAPLKSTVDRLWRTDLKLGRNIYGLLSNDVQRPSPLDPLIGVMETSELAENVVDTHNRALTKFGRHYMRVLSTDV
jgi:hypothetical protein